MATGFNVGVHHRLFHADMVRRRKALGMSQHDLADACLTEYNNIGEIERLRRWPNPDLAGKIADVLDGDVATLFPPWMKEKIYERLGLPTSYITEHTVTVESLDTVRHLELPSPMTLDAEDDLLRQEDLKVAIAQVLDTLKPREQEVLRLRFGLEDGKPKTLEEVGQVMGVGRERARQVEQIALRKLRYHSRAKILQKVDREDYDFGRPFDPYWRKKIREEKRAQMIAARGQG